jgi:hypothetical protein
MFRVVVVARPRRLIISPQQEQWSHHCRFLSKTKKRKSIKKPKRSRSLISRVDWATDASIDWDDRQELQNKWTLAEKGWEVAVEWKITSEHGVGVFAQEKIAPGTILRRGRLGYNLVQFHNVADIEAFVATTTTGGPRAGDNDNDSAMEAKKWRYVADYLWGFHYRTNDDGHPFDENSSLMFIGMWIPGNGLNHHKKPNTIYQVPAVGDDDDDENSKDDTLHLVAVREIFQGEQLYDDYRRHGKAPMWLQPLIRHRQLQLNFKDCNNFVVPK